MSREISRTRIDCGEKTRYNVPMNSIESGQSPEKARFYVNRIKWLEYLCAHPEISHATFRVGCLLALKTNAKEQTCWWSVEAIADEIGCNRWTVTEATKALVELDLLMVARRRGGRQNIYSLVFPWDL